MQAYKAILAAAVCLVALQMTSAAQDSSLEAAKSAYEKGDYHKAIDNLTNYRGDDNMAAAEALGSTADAYVELKDYDKAETYFKKAADKANNKFLTPVYLKKLGLVYEAQNDNKSADDTYKRIKSEYPDSQQAQNIDEYIARAEAKL